MDDPVREFKRGPWWSWSRFQAFLRTELGHLTTVHASDRPWQMPLAAALASGLPLMVGAWFNRLDYGLASSLGGLVFLYVPRTALHHRMVTLMACAFGMSACYALGLMSHFYPALMALSLAVITLLATMVCRFYAVGPPGSFFFVMAAAIGAHMPIHVPDFPLYVGLFTLGCVLACLTHPTSPSCRSISLPNRSPSPRCRQRRPKAPRTSRPAPAPPWRACAWATGST